MHTVGLHQHGVLVPLSAIRPRTSSPPVLSLVSSLALSLTRLAGSFTTLPRAVSSPLRTSRLTRSCSLRCLSGRPTPGAVPGEVAVDSGAARGTVSGGTELWGAGPGGAEPGGAETGGAEPGGAETGGAEPGGVETGVAEPGGAEPEGDEPGGAAWEGVGSGGAEPQGAASSGATGAGGAGAGGAGIAAGAGVTGGTAATGPGGARTRVTGAAGTGGFGGAGDGDPTESGAAGAGGSGAGGAGAGGAGVGGTGVGGSHGILTPQSYAKAITSPYSFQWQIAMDAEMESWKSTGTCVDEVPPPGVNIVVGLWIFRVKRPPGSPPAFKARYVARGFTFLQGGRHEEIWHHRPPGFTGSFPAGTQWSHRQPVYGLRQAPREWHDRLRTTLAALGFAPSTADPSVFLRTDTSLPPFYVLVYLGLQITQYRARRTITLTQSHMVHQVLQRFGFQFSSPQPTPLSTSHSLSTPPSDKSVEPSGPNPELVDCLMYLMTCTRPDLAYPLSLLARYVAPGSHRKVHWDAAKRVLRYLCKTSGMGLVLGGRVVLTGHADASWVDDSATQLSSQGYTFSLGSGFVTQGHCSRIT
ncbi:unnamed protein product [Closterium sp. NIES-54]